MTCYRHPQTCTDGVYRITPSANCVTRQEPWNIFCHRVPQPSPKDATGGDTTVFFMNLLTSWSARGPRRGPDRNPK
ncbi:hypothetical protein DPMN_078347 [Dreissena polymorpha]|uniref:Uncharacterized protein n=1 Tax=Dreissena polymorpha TaxID=45954 RepID=A0A9D3YQC6_DREPO|nr:hypothetical protein DPMN_078347 [Dreissena polymorpha]